MKEIGRNWSRERLDVMSSSWCCTEEFIGNRFATSGMDVSHSKRKTTITFSYLYGIQLQMLPQSEGEEKKFFQFNILPKNMTSLSSSSFFVCTRQSLSDHKLFGIDVWWNKILALCMHRSSVTWCEDIQSEIRAFALVSSFVSCVCLPCRRNPSGNIKQAQRSRRDVAVYHLAEEHQFCNRFQCIFRCSSDDAMRKKTYSDFDLSSIVE